MESAIIFRVNVDQLTEVISLGLAMVEKTQLDPAEIILDGIVIKWNRADAVALVSNRITDEEYIERNGIGQK